MSDEDVTENTEEVQNDDLVEFEYNEDGEEDIKKTLKKVRTDLKLCHTEKQDILTAWQRERADFSNYKKEEEKRSQDFLKIARERFILELVPVLDSYDMAFSNKEAWERVDKNWRIGVEYIHQQLLKVLSESGVTEINDIGVLFNPNLHQAIETVVTSDKAKDHTIDKVVQKGYKIGDRIFRPAHVTVFEYQESK